MALRSSTLLLVFGIIIGSFAVAQAAGRSLLNDDKDKCYPYTYNYKKQEKCPYGHPKDCFDYKPEYGYVTVYKKENYYCPFDYNKIAIAYTDTYGYKQCTDGKWKFEVSCKEDVTFYYVDEQYYNEDAKEVKENACKYYNYYYYSPPYPECSVCDYEPVKYECKEKDEYDHKNGKRNLLSVADKPVGRELLGDGKHKDNKCYPKNKYYYPKPCPYGNPEYCFDYVSYKDYVKVTKKPCYDNYGKDKVSIYYTDTYGKEQCSDGKYSFKAKCDKEVKLYILEKYNEYGYQMKKDKCNYDYYDKCSVCDYKVLKFPCKKEDEYEYKKEKEYKD